MRVWFALTKIVLTLSVTGLIALLGCSDPEGEDNGPEGEENGGTDPEVIGDATFEVSVSLSPAIETVGIVTWSIDQPIERATIEFGPDTDYRWTAPVDLSLEGYRTLLLGMKPNNEYHFQIVAKGDGVSYVSEDFTVETGNLPSGLPSKTVSMDEPSRLAGGFVISCSYSNPQGVFILDEDGDFVWWYSPANLDFVRARMSFDGQYMIIANGNVPGPDDGAMFKVSMDGLEEESFDVPLRHHDATVLPDETIAYFEYDEDGAGICDRVMERSPDGTTREIFNLRDHFSHRESAGEWCHSNAINYLQDEDAYTLSVLNFNAIIKFDRAGNLIWTFGGDDSDFPGVSWVAQHQHQLMDGSLLFFNNRGETGASFGNASRVLEYELDESRLTASMVWEYSSGQMLSPTMGDAKRLPNGNTLVTFSTNGVIQEVGPNGETLSEVGFGMGSAMGYSIWRKSLYGPPTEYL